MHDKHKEEPEKKIVKNCYLIGEIDFRSIKEIYYDLDEAEADNKYESVKLVLSTVGGSLYASFALFDHIKKLSKPVDIIAEGCCFSAGVMLLQAGRMRSSTENTIFMVHPSRYSFGEKKPYEEVITLIDQYSKDHEKFVDLTIQRSGFDKEKYIKIYSPSKYLTAQEALKFGENGLIDEIIRPQS